MVPNGKEWYNEIMESELKAFESADEEALPEAAEKLKTAITSEPLLQDDREKLSMALAQPGKNRVIVLQKIRENLVKRVGIFINLQKPKPQVHFRNGSMNPPQISLSDSSIA